MGFGWTWPWLAMCGMGDEPDRSAASERRRDRRDVGTGDETTQHRAPPKDGLCSGLFEEKRSVEPGMGQEVELSALDLRYESYRMKNPALEGRLLASIARRGIEEPLEGVDRADERSILLNGFKRYRCASKLGIRMAPYASLAEEEALGILNLLRISNDRSLTILEQARFIDELRQMHQMSVADLAEQLSRSKAWVSMRLGLIGEMSPAVRERIFSGGFPVYPYMYTLRQFMRMNGVSKQDIEDFVVALSGKKLSVREIEQLAHGYFRGPASFRDAIREGHIALALNWVQQV